MHVEFCSVYDPKPFIFLLDMAELVPGPLQLHLQALDANHSLQQVLVKIRILLLQRPEHRGMMGDGVLFPKCAYPRDYSEVLPDIFSNISCFNTSHKRTEGMKSRSRTYRASHVAVMTSRTIQGEAFSHMPPFYESIHFAWSWFLTRKSILSATFCHVDIKLHFY